MIDHPCGNLVIVVSAVLVLSCGQKKQTDTQTDTDERLTPATLVGVSKYVSLPLCLRLFLRAVYAEYIRNTLYIHGMLKIGLNCVCELFVT